MKTYIYRNFTVENLFESDDLFSGYDDFLHIPKDIKNLIWFYIFPINTNSNALELVKNYLDRIQYILSNMEIDQSLIIFTLSSRANHFIKANRSIFHLTPSYQTIIPFKE